MFRREALRQVAAVGVAGALAGCGSSEPAAQGGQQPPEEPDDGGPTQGGGLRVAALDYREDESGNLVVLVTIANGGEGSRSGTLKTTVGLGDRTLTESQEVTVAGGGSQDVEIAFEASFEAFEQDGSIDVELETS